MGRTTNCQECPFGTFNTKEQQVDCSRCSNNEYKANPINTTNNLCSECSLNAQCNNGVCANNFEAALGCTTCTPNHYGSKCTKCPPMWLTLFNDAFISIVGLYFLLAFLFLLFYESADEKLDLSQDASDASNDAHDTVVSTSQAVEKNKAMKQVGRAGKKKVQRLGRSMRRILVNQMQVLSAIFPSITWSPYLPPILIQVVQDMTSLFTIDFSVVFMSPVCGAQATMRDQWVIRVMIPVMLALVFLAWASAVYWYSKCHQNRSNKNMQTLLIILRIAVRVLLLGLYKTAVETSMGILNCNEYKNELVWKDNEPCPVNGTDAHLAVVGMLMVVLYGILPYLFITIQLFRHGRPTDGVEEQTMSTGYILYGWAREGYKTVRMGTSQCFDYCIDCRVK
jgi:hypothetical protein